MRQNLLACYVELADILKQMAVTHVSGGGGGGGGVGIRKGEGDMIQYSQGGNVRYH